MIQQYKPENPRPGFKLTKLGWLPEEWEVVRLGEIANLVNGKAYKQEELLDEGIYRVLRVGNLFSSKSWYYSDLELPSDKYVENGDLMYAWSASFGPMYWYGEKTIYHYHIWKVLVNINALKSFLYYLLEYDVQKLMRAKQGGTMFHVTKGDMEKRKFPLPPLPEQTRIATCLATWDRAITTTRHLLEQLEMRKTGLMQRLLTGEVRLPGFEGEWEEFRAERLFSSISDKKHNGEFEVLSATQERGVIPRSEVGIDIKYDKSSLSSYKKVMEGDFVISLRSFQGGIEYSKYTGLVSPAYTVLRGSEETDYVFFTEYFKTQTFINRLNSIIYGIRDGKQISYKEFSSLKILIPSISEQKAIGEVIGSIQAEIALYNEKLATLETQKRGLMQQLLTGQKRLSA